MLVTLEGIVTLVSPLQPENAPSRMLVTLAGIVTLVSPLQPENAESAMRVTGLPAMLSGMTTVVTLSRRAQWSSVISVPLSV